jgi:hypothetical protein
MTQYSDIHKYNKKEKQDLYAQLCNTAHCQKSVINMGIKIHNNFPFEPRIENVNVFKNKLESHLLQNSFYSLQVFLVTMIDRNLVTQISFDMLQKYIDGLWTVIFTKHVMLCFTWLTCVFRCLCIFIASY